MRSMYYVSNFKILLIRQHKLGINELTHLFSSLVADKRVDFALNTFGVRKSRAKAVDYLIINKYVGQGWFYIKNPRNTYDWTVFFQPLYEEAWIGLLVFSFITPLLIAIIEFFRKLSIICYKVKLCFVQWIITTYIHNDF